MTHSLFDENLRSEFHTLRIYQLNNLYYSLLAHMPQLHKFSWGELFTGHLDDALADHTHPNRDFACVLWGDMILYYLSRI